MSNDPGEILLFQTEDDQTRIDVRLARETVWLSAGQIAELFQRDKSTISRHIQDVFDERELKLESVVALSATTAADGKSYQVTPRPRVPAPSSNTRPIAAASTLNPPGRGAFDEAVKKEKLLADPKMKIRKKTRGEA